MIKFLAGFLLAVIMLAISQLIRKVETLEEKISEKVAPEKEGK